MPSRRVRQISTVQSLRHGAFQVGSEQSHPHHELLCVTQGDYTVSTAQGRWHGGPGDVFLYPAGLSHRVELDPAQESHFLIVNWRQEGLPARARHAHDRSARIVATLMWMFDCWPPPDEATRHVLIGLFEAVLYEFDRLSTPTEPDDMVRRTIQLMRADLHRRLTVQEMAEVVGLSRFHFTRRFRAATGQTPQRYIQGLRVEAALHLLTASREPLQGIAKRCGIATASRLSDLILTHTGRRPSAWRT